MIFRCRQLRRHAADDIFADYAAFRGSNAAILAFDYTHFAAMPFAATIAAFRLSDVFAASFDSRHFHFCRLPPCCRDDDDLSAFALSATAFTPR